MAVRSSSPWPGRSRFRVYVADRGPMVARAVGPPSEAPAAVTVTDPEYRKLGVLPSTAMPEKVSVGLVMESTPPSVYVPVRTKVSDEGGVPSAKSSRIDAMSLNRSVPLAPTR